MSEANISEIMWHLWHVVLVEHEGQVFNQSDGKIKEEIKAKIISDAEKMRKDMVPDSVAAESGNQDPQTAILERLQRGASTRNADTTPAPHNTPVTMSGISAAVRAGMRRRGLPILLQETRTTRRENERTGFALGI